MTWSKQRKMLKSCLCDCLKDRIDFHIMKYRRVARGKFGRVVVKLDKQEIVSFVRLSYENKHYEVYKAYRENEKEEELRYTLSKKGYKIRLDRSQWKEIERVNQNINENVTKIINEKGYFSELQFYDAVNMYLNMTIEDAIKSDNILVRALAMFDRRLGKRRLIKMYDSIENEHDLVKKFYEIRINAEKISGKNCV